MLDDISDKRGGGAAHGRGVVAGVQQRRRQRAARHRRLRQLPARARHRAQSAQRATLRGNTSFSVLRYGIRKH